MSGDSEAQRLLAVKQRDSGYLNPGDRDYDKKLRKLWGGPGIRWYHEAVNAFPASYNVSDKVVLVTGSSGGIGFYIAKLFAHCGYTVIIPSRPGLESEAQGAMSAISEVVPEAKIVIPSSTLDLRSFASVREFAATVREAHPCIDVLCLNAGRGGGTSDPREVTGDGQEAIMQVNTTSQWLLACELLPSLQASPRARIVCQSSGARFNVRPEHVNDLDGTDSNTFNPWTQYSLSKACMCLFARALNDRLVAHGINNVIALVSEPGLTATGVNIQHDLVKSLGLTRRGLKNTNEMHDQAGHHAADGALPMTLAGLTGERNDFFCTNGNRSGSLAEAAFKTPLRGRDEPMLWDTSVCDKFWDNANVLTGARWPFAPGIPVDA